MTDAEDPFNAIANGTGPFMLDHWTKGTEIVLTKNPNYWGTAAKLDRVVISVVPEFGTRFAALQAGDADIIDVDVASRIQVDPLVGEMRAYDATTNAYGPVQNVCSVDTTKLGAARFTTCDTPSDKPLRLYIGRPAISQDVLLYNFLIQ